MLNWKFCVLWGITATCVSSCELYNPDEQVPAYIRIDSFVVVDNLNVNEGSLSHDIRDAWVYVDDQPMGVYELPATFPVLATGAHKLTIGPGIYVSTSSELRDNYLFYNAYIDPAFNLNAGKTTALTPITSYRDEGNGYKYIVAEDFEKIYSVVDTFSGSEVGLSITHDPKLVFEGAGSGLVSLTSDRQRLALKTQAVVLPRGGKTVFLEFNYYTDYFVEVGLYANNSNAGGQTLSIVTLKPTTDKANEKRWKKAYVALGESINLASSPVDFFAYFNVAQAESSIGEGIFMLDNIKFLYSL